MKCLQTEPKVKTMKINFYDFYNTVIKNLTDVEEKESQMIQLKLYVLKT